MKNNISIKDVYNCWKIVDSVFKDENELTLYYMDNKCYIISPLSQGYIISTYSTNHFLLRRYKNKKVVKIKKIKGYWVEQKENININNIINQIDNIEKCKNKINLCKILETKFMMYGKIQDIVMYEDSCKNIYTYDRNVLHDMCEDNCNTYGIDDGSQMRLVIGITGVCRIYLSRHPYEESAYRIQSMISRVI